MARTGEPNDAFLAWRTSRLYFLFFKQDGMATYEPLLFSKKLR